MNIFFLILGGLSALLGLLTLIAALRGRVGESRKSTAQLIAGMMLLAFGLVLAGFTVAYSTTKPYPEFAKEAGAP